MSSDHPGPGPLPSEAMRCLLHTSDPRAPAWKRIRKKKKKTPPPFFFKLSSAKGEEQSEAAVLLREVRIRNTRTRFAPWLWLFIGVPRPLFRHNREMNVFSWDEQNTGMSRSLTSPFFYSSFTSFCWIHMCLCRFNISLEYVNPERESPETLVLCAERIMHSIIFSVNISHQAASAVDCKNGNSGCELFPVVSPRYTVNQAAHCIHAVWLGEHQLQLRRRNLNLLHRRSTRSWVGLLTPLKVQSWRPPRNQTTFLINCKGCNSFVNRQIMCSCEWLGFTYSVFYCQWQGPTHVGVPDSLAF